MKRKVVTLFLVLLTLTGLFLRSYNLNWGSPYFFHPDERNIASAVLNINFPDSLNPHFFAYGAFPIYLVSLMNRFIGLFLKTSSYDHFALAILVGRFFSAILSTALIPLVFILTKKILATLNNWSNGSDRVDLINKDFWALVAAFLTAFNPGLIQYAHFSTFEIFLTIEYLLMTIFAIEIALTGKKRFYLLTGLLLGLACATKINSLMFVPVLFLAHWFNPNPKSNQSLLTAFATFVLVAFFASPFNLLDFSELKSALNYESSVALGNLAVFYTQGFLKTTPILFQFKSVFPFLWGWSLTILGILGGLGMLAMVLRDKLQTNRAKVLLIFISVPLTYWLFNSFLFVQWMRYSVPLIPFVIIAAIIFFFKFFKVPPSGRWNLKGITLLLALVLSTSISGITMFLTYREPDTRIQAAKWLAEQSRAEPRGDPSRSTEQTHILSEVYDLGITPFNTYFDPSTISLFDFYGLDPDPRLQFNPKQTALDKKSKLEELSRLLEKSDYIVLPSPRIWRTRLRLPNEFPSNSSFYQKLFDGNLGFVKVADFQNKACDKFLAIRCLWLNDDNAEETYTVFDRPEVLIFQKEEPLLAPEYYRIII